VRRPAVWLVVLLLVAVAVTVYVWSSTSAAPGTVVAGTVSEIQSQRVIYLPEPGIYVVATDDGFLALGDDSRHVGDRVLFCSLDDTFSSPAHGERFDIEGRYLGGPAQGDMARYPVTAESGEVVVDVSGAPELPPRSEQGGSAKGPVSCDGGEDPPGFYANDGT
jgi:Rieske Fe-S protein